MRKLVSILLLLALVLSVCACGGGDKTASTSATTQTPSAEATTVPAGMDDPYAGVFRVGYARTVITPTLPVPMRGYGNTSQRVSGDVRDDLYATCTVISDEQNNSVAIFTMDLCQVQEEPLERIRSIALEYGFAPENLFVNSSHTHAGPDTASGLESAVEYKEYLYDQVEKALQKALEDRSPVTDMSVGIGQTENMNFSRHYILEDGSYAGDSFGDWSRAPIAQHVVEADPEYRLLRFQRETGKDVVLMNWQSHPSLCGWVDGGPSLLHSADFVHPLRESMEELADCYFSYMQGAAGGNNNGSRMTDEGYKGGPDVYMQFGYEMACMANETLENHMTSVQTGTIRTTRTEITLPINHDQDTLFYKAKELSAIWKTTGDREQIYELGRPYGISSPYHAEAIVSRYSMGESASFYVGAFSIGDEVGFTTAPFETFDVNAKYERENSPFRFTFTLGYTNGSMGYLPADYVWDYTSYETDTHRFHRGSAEVVQSTHMEQLTALSELAKAEE
ncbi:MAG: hypothetical protein E7437_08195 [Ruminococcaceae bacterium]|nr:hypothetical protein [Oscillospiraceae bacterium]